MYTFNEFFAGGGMARAGLGHAWTCLFANDKDPQKCAIYEKNWGNVEIVCKDVKELGNKDIKQRVDLVWGSFPCQDLSLAGGGAGLEGSRSSVFWPFWNLVCKGKTLDELPKIIVLENVLGTLTSHVGKDFSSICDAFQANGYQIGAMVLDAASFLPQSRKRLFFIGVRKDLFIPEHLVSDEPIKYIHTNSLVNAKHNRHLKKGETWLWWNIPEPQKATLKLIDILDSYESAYWDTPKQTQNILNMMPLAHREKIDASLNTKSPIAGTVFKRMRKDSSGKKIQRAELRLDGIAGCLRTPSGGSSKQILVYIFNGNVSTRLLSARETARLMGLNDSYILPENTTSAYHLTGDGVAVPVVRYLAEHILEPILIANKMSAIAAE